jgi:hypothetical protein
MSRTRYHDNSKLDKASRTLNAGGTDEECPSVRGPLAYPLILGYVSFLSCSLRENRSPDGTLFIKRTPIREVLSLVAPIPGEWLISIYVTTVPPLAGLSESQRRRVVGF